MTLEVIGVGWGRTATNSLKLALQDLGFGLCHHMWEVAGDQDRLVPLWNAALAGSPDWPALFEGNRSAVDWPTAGFWDDLAEVYPDARLILTTRSADSWYDSIAGTILKVIENPEDAPEVRRPVSRMARDAVMRSIGDDWSREAMTAKFRAHEKAVQETISPERLLVFSPTDGWGPLCAFLGKDVPEGPFPRSNARDEFFAEVNEIGT